jgi:inhibitor of KinA
LECNFVIFPLGDSAATIDLSDQISEELNRKVLAMHRWLSENPIEGVKDLILGYSSLSLFYDPVLIKKKYSVSTTSYQFVRNKLEEAWLKAKYPVEKEADELVHIPVCYDYQFGIDLDFVSREKGLSGEEIATLHSSKIYRVFMIGFLPGFCYLGQLDEKLVIPRKLKPVPVIAGSVGIAGGQTGIYSLYCPGGWQIIGRTPLKLFDAESPVPVKLKAGDRVRFHPITREEFEKL